MDTSTNTGAASAVPANDTCPGSGESGVTIKGVEGRVRCPVCGRAVRTYTARPLPKHHHRHPMSGALL